MNCLRTLRALRAVAATSLLGSACLLGLPAAEARADSPLSVTEARQLFGEALKEQEGGKLAEALAKFQRVQSVRDTSPVRYQIAKCTEGLNRIAKARELYLRTVDGTQIPSTEDPSVASASREAAARLASRVGYVRIDGPAMRGAERLVDIDGDEWAGAGLHEVDPGNHELRIRSDDGKTRTVGFLAASGVTSSVKLFTVPSKGAAPSGVAVTTEPAPGPAKGSITPWAWVSLGGGAAFLTTGIVLLAVREHDISTVHGTCPSDVCALSSRSDVESHLSRARTLGVLGPVATVLGAAGLAVGTGLILFGPRSHARATAAWVRSSAWASRSGIAPLPGGAQVFAGAAF